MKPVDATHKGSLSKLYFKESDSGVYLWSSKKWIKLSLPTLLGNSHIFPIPTK